MMRSDEGRSTLTRGKTAGGSLASLGCCGLLGRILQRLEKCQPHLICSCKAPRHHATFSVIRGRQNLMPFRHNVGEALALEIF